METTTTFDLNQAIHNWRNNLAQSPAFRSGNLRELETHLRDSVVGLETRGLSPEEAFLVASRRIGHVDSLVTEFGKVNLGRVWLDRVIWMLIGLQLWRLILGPIGVISNSVVSLGLLGGNFNFAARGLTIPVILFAAMHLLAFAGSLAICCWLIVRRGQSFALSVERFLSGWGTLTIVCGVLCLISWVVSALGAASWPLVMKFAGPQAIGDVIASQNYAGMFAYYIQTGMLMLLTLILARKRLELCRAQ